MLQYRHHRFVDVASAVCPVTVGLEFCQGVDVAVYRCLCQGETHGDVYVLHLFGQGVKHGHKHSLVAQHHGILLLLCSLRQFQSLHPLGQEACLCIFRRCREETYLLGSAHYVQTAFRQLVRKQFQVAQDKFAGFVLVGRIGFGRTSGVEHVVVPVEPGLSSLLQAQEERLFHPVQYVEAYEYIAVVVQPLRVQFLHHLAVHHALVGNAQLRQPFAVVPVDVSQLVPQADEFLLQFRPLLDGEVSEEFLYCLLLFLTQVVGDVHDVLQILQVAEEPVCVHQVLVYVVKVTDQQLSPEVEVVQCLFAFRFFAEHPVEFTHQPDGISRFPG